MLTIAAFPGAALAAPPANTTAPSITIPTGGAPTEITNPSEGRILTSTPGTWNPAQTTFVYQWTHDCTLPVGATPGNPGTAIPRANNSTYKIANGDIGHTLCLTVSAGGSAPVISSNQTGVVTAGTPIDRAAPTVSGVLQDGQTLTANPGTWDGTAPISYGYQWRHCDANGKNCDVNSSKWFPATPSSSPSYVLQDSDLGHTMSVVVTATNSVGATVQGSFATSGVVTPANTGVPKISGTPQQGQNLTESHGSWLPSTATLVDQWESCDASGGGCSPIAGATSPTYKPTTADVGHTLVVQETASQAGVSNTASSVPTGVVQAAPVTNAAGPGGSQGGNQGGGPTGGQPAPTGSSPAPAAVTVAQLGGLLRNALAVHGKGAHISALLKHGGYSFTFASPSAGTLAVSWYRRLHGHTILIAKVTVRFHKTGKENLKLVLTSKGRALLKGVGRMTLTAQGGFTPVGHHTTSASKTITLKG